jgi:hypothetical protein
MLCYSRAELKILNIHTHIIELRAGAVWIRELLYCFSYKSFEHGLILKE